nr:uncharacterized protein LOC105862814 [Microcebus murinus]
MGCLLVVWLRLCCGGCGAAAVLAVVAAVRLRLAAVAAAVAAAGATGSCGCGGRLREGLLPAEVLLPAELRLQEAVLLLGAPLGCGQAPQAPALWPESLFEAQRPPGLPPAQLGFHADLRCRHPSALPDTAVHFSTWNALSATTLAGLCGAGRDVPTCVAVLRMPGSLVMLFYESVGVQERALAGTCSQELFHSRSWLLKAM